MQVILRHDDNINGGERLTAMVEGVVTDALRRYGNQVVTVQVSLTDANSHKKGEDDKRCMMEARLGGLKPISVSHDAATLDLAVDGCAEKLQRTIDKTVGRIGDHKGNMPMGGPPGV